MTTTTRPWKQSMADIYRNDPHYREQRTPHPLLEFISEIAREGNRHDISFPTFGVCTGCGHYNKAYHQGQDIDDRATLQRLLDIAYGVNLANWRQGNWGNRFYPPELCKCDHEHTWTAYTGPDRQVGRCLSDIVCTHPGCGVRRVIDSSD